MKLLLYIKSLLNNIINTNNLVVMLTLLKKTNYFYIFIISFFISALGLCSFLMIPIPDIFSDTKISIPIIFIVIYSIPTLLIVYMIFIERKNMRKYVLRYPNIKGVSKFSNFIDYYYKLIPVCIVTTGIALITLSIYHECFLSFGVNIFGIGCYVFLILAILKITFYNMGTSDIYNNMTRANDIFTNYISSNKSDIKYLAIKEFTKHFLRVLDGIDFHFEAVFDKGINIDCLQNNENITVKQLMKRYLPIYLSYCSEAELNLFKIKLNSMVNLIDNKNIINSLDIIEIVNSIHQDIVKFLDQHSYVVPKNTLITNLIYKTNKKSKVLSKTFISIFIIIGFFYFFIPSEVRNEIFDTLNGTLSDFLVSDVNYIAIILPFLASIPVLYKFLKELCE